MPLSFENAPPEMIDTIEVWNAAPGISGIFHFPFRIYSSETLYPIERINPATGFRYKISFIESNYSTKRPTVPLEFWPNFETHPQAPFKVDSLPEIDLSYGGIKYGDKVFEKIEYSSQLRLDIWANNISPEVLEEFCSRFLDLTRLYTDQYWINAFEANFSLKNLVSVFPIDDLGRCLSIPSAGQEIRGHVFKPLYNDFVRQLFDRAILGDKVDEYWRIFFEASNLFIRGFSDQAVLQLALSLEISRFVNLRPFMLIRKETAAGTVFRPPFNDTDLLKNLHGHLISAIGRSLKEEKPELWESVEQLYKARHQVAHGKKAAFTTADGGPLIGVDIEIFFKWAIAIRNTNAWLIKLKNTDPAV